MHYVFDRGQLEDVKFCIDNLGVCEAFKVVNNLGDRSTVPVDDLIDFQNCFTQQYKLEFGCSY